MFHFNSHINLIPALGLIFDMIGVILVFRNGLPSPILATTSFIVDESSPSEEEIAISTKRVTRNAKTGLWLIGLGFLLQLAGTIVFFDLCPSMPNKVQGTEQAQGIQRQAKTDTTAQEQHLNQSKQKRQ
jgi:hypothetical protein